MFNGTEYDDNYFCEDLSGGLKDSLTPSTDDLGTDLEDNGHVSSPFEDADQDIVTPKESAEAQNVNSSNNDDADNNSTEEYKVLPTESRKDTLAKQFFKKTIGEQRKELVHIAKDGLMPEYKIFLFNTNEPCICDEIPTNTWYFRGAYINIEEKEDLKKREATNPNCFRKITGIDRYTVCRRLVEAAGIDMQLLEDAEFKKLAGYAAEGDVCGPVDPEHSEQPFSGLVNLGLTCYFNSALQSLFSNVEFRNIVYEFVQKREKNASEKKEITEKVSEEKEEEEDNCTNLEKVSEEKEEEEDNCAIHEKTCEGMEMDDEEEEGNDDDDDDDDDDEKKKEEESKKDETKGKESEEDRNMRENVVLELQKLFAEMEFSILSRVSPKELVSAMGLPVGVQQDASEFYEKFVEMIFSVLSKNSKDLKERLERCINGKIQYETVCTSCKDVSVSKDVLSQIKLPICDDLNFLSGEDNNNNNDDDDYYDDDYSYDLDYGYNKNTTKTTKDLEKDSLTTLIKKYFSKEDIEGRCCEKCGCTCNAERTVKFTYLPDELTIGLLTFGYNVQKDISEKVIKSIFIPEQLDMSDYLDEGSKSGCESEFLLSAVICHIGVAANSGHYITYAKKYGKWWEFDDSKVTMLKTLPFKLTDAEGNLLYQESAEADKDSKACNWSQLVYDFKKGRYVSKSEVKTESSVTPFMLFYKKRSVLESEKVVCPREVREAIVKAGLAKKAEIDSARSAAADIEKKTDEAAAEFDKLMAMVPVKPDVEDYYWVPTEWFTKYKSSLLDSLQKGVKSGGCDHKDGDDGCCGSLKVSTKGFLCAHGKLGPKKAASMKRVSVESWNYIKEKFGVAEGEPELNASSECVLCAKEYGLEVREAVLNADIRMMLWDKDGYYNINYQDLFYYVDKSFYDETFKSPYLHKGPLPTEIVVNPTEGITCSHGGFKNKDSKKISKETWEWIKAHVTNDVKEAMKEFSNKTEQCALCAGEVKEIKAIKKKISELCYKSYYSEEVYSNPTDIADIQEGVLYCVLKSEWFDAIRDNCHETYSKPMNQDLNFKGLLCKHGNFYEDIDTIFGYQGTHKLVSEKFWALASKVYKYEGTPIMLLCKHNGYTIWNDKNKPFEYETYPPRCKQCDAEYLLNAYTYDKSTIVLHYNEYYYTTAYPRDVTVTDFTSATTIMDLKLYMSQYIEKDFADIKLTYDGRILGGDERTLGECKVPRKADIYVGDMTEKDRKTLAAALAEEKGETLPAKKETTLRTADGSDVGFGNTKCFQNMI